MTKIESIFSPDIQAEINNCFYNLDDKSLRQPRNLTLFDYVFLFNGLPFSLLAQDKDTFDVLIDGKASTLSKDNTKYIEHIITFDNKKDLGNIINDLIEKLSVKESKGKNVFDVKNYIPVFYHASGFGVIHSLNYDRVRILDPVAGFPLELTVIYNKNNITIHLSLNVNYIKNEF